MLTLQLRVQAVFPSRHTLRLIADSFSSQKPGMKLEDLSERYAVKCERLRL